MQKDYLVETDGKFKLNTQQMIEDSFLSELGQINPTKSAELRNASKVKLKNVSSLKSDPNPTELASLDYEQLLMALYETRDGLIELFSSVNYHSNVGMGLTSQINKVGDCIQQMGGQVDTFNPLDHISGLEAPNQVINAQKVIDQTKSYYTLGSIDSASVSNDGKIIKIAFKGKDGDVSYRADGEITAKGMWTGNEAIDYIYAPQSGKMSVKALNENGCWIDKYNDYDIYWELIENIDDLPQDDNIKKSQSIEEHRIKIENNLDDINTDFEIVEEGQE